MSVSALCTDTTRTVRTPVLVSQHLCTHSLQFNQTEWPGCAFTQPDMTGGLWSCTTEAEIAG